MKKEQSTTERNFERIRIGETWKRAKKDLEKDTKIFECVSNFKLEKVEEFLDIMSFLLQDDKETMSPDDSDRIDNIIDDLIADSE